MRSQPRTTHGHSLPMLGVRRGRSGGASYRRSTQMQYTTVNSENQYSSKLFLACCPCQ